METTTEGYRLLSANRCWGARHALCESLSLRERPTRVYARTGALNYDTVSLLIITLFASSPFSPVDKVDPFSVAGGG